MTEATTPESAAPRQLPAHAQAQVRPGAQPGYAGDITVQAAYAWQQAGWAVLVDIRSAAEWTFVGQVPQAIAVEWKSWPGMVPNPEFDAQLQAAVPVGARLLMLCRSGVRSIAAAQRATALGFEAYNILEGFEGDLDAQGHRGKTGGWRHHGLPWRQT